MEFGRADTASFRKAYTSVLNVDLEEHGESIVNRQVEDLRSASTGEKNKVLGTFKDIKNYKKTSKREKRIMMMDGINSGKSYKKIKATAENQEQWRDDVARD